MSGPERVIYLTFAVMAIVLACLKLWWWAAVSLACVGITFMYLKTFEDPEDW
jgi:hypothetical protein